MSVEVGSSGAIYGAGGNGGEAGTSDGDKDGDNGGSGSSGLGVQFSGTTVINNGVISAGYGGGGGGGYRKVEREEWWQGPVYRATGGGGGGGQGLPGGAAGTGAGGGSNFYLEQGVFGVDANNRVFRKMGIIATVDSISAADAARTAGTYTNVSQILIKTILPNLLKRILLDLVKVFLRSVTLISGLIKNI